MAEDDLRVSVEKGIEAPSSPVRTRNATRRKHKRNRSVSRATMPLPPRDQEEIVASASTAFLEENEPATNRKTRQRASVHQITIRPMTMKDIAPVFHLGNCIFTATEYPNMYRTWDDFTVVENYEGSGNFCFVAHHKEMLVGFLLGHAMIKVGAETRGYIQWVAVHPDHRRTGIATRLLEQFTSTGRLQQISRLLADTPADNTPAIQMFEKVGLCTKTDHVYLTRQLKNCELTHVDENGEFNFSYSVKKRELGAVKISITIRNMQIDDLHPIYRIGEQIFTAESANLYNFWDESLVLQSYLSDPELCVVATTTAENGEEVVIGFAFGTTIEKPRSSWKYGYLVWLGCASEYQGLGLASQLYTVMQELFTLEKVRMLMIDTQQNNHAALKFFRKMGFGHDEEHVYLCNTPGAMEY